MAVKNRHKPLLKGGSCHNADRPAVIEWAPGLRWVSIDHLGLILGLSKNNAGRFCRALGIPMIGLGSIMYVRYEFIIILVAYVSQPGQPSVNLTRFPRGYADRLKKRQGYLLGHQYESKRLKLMSDPDIIRSAITSIAAGCRVTGSIPDRDFPLHILAAYRDFVDFFHPKAVATRHPKWARPRKQARVPLKYGRTPAELCLNKFESTVYRVWSRIIGPSAGAEPSVALDPDGLPARSNFRGWDGPDPVLLRPGRDIEGSRWNRAGRARSSRLSATDDDDQLERPEAPVPSPEGGEGVPGTGPSTPEGHGPAS